MPYLEILANPHDALFKDNKLSWLRGKVKPLGTIAGVATLVLIYMYWAKVDHLGFVSIRESIFYIQKLSLAGVALVWLKNMGDRQPKWLAIFADDAFSIYFLHIFFIFACFGFLFPLLANSDLYPFNVFISALVMFTVSLALTRLIVFLTHRGLGRHSRMVVGS